MADDLHVTGVALDTRKALQELRRLDRGLRRAERQVDDVAQRIERIEDGENPDGVVTGLGPVLRSFAEDVQDFPADAPGEGGP